MEEITVIIPNYNGIKFLEECLEALLDQEEGTPDFRVLVVDNGSRDGSREVAARFPGVSLLALDTNTGFCRGVNEGIRASDTPYVILLNNDTRVRGHFVKGLYEAVCSSPSVFSVSARMLMWDRPELIDDAGDRYCALGWAYARGKGKPASRYDSPAEIFS